MQQNLKNTSLLLLFFSMHNGENNIYHIEFWEKKMVICGKSELAFFYAKVAYFW